MIPVARLNMELLVDTREAPIYRQGVWILFEIGNGSTGQEPCLKMVAFVFVS